VRAVDRLHVASLQPSKLAVQEVELIMHCFGGGVRSRALEALTRLPLRYLWTRLNSFSFDNRSNPSNQGAVSGLNSGSFFFSRRPPSKNRARGPLSSKIALLSNVCVVPPFHSPVVMASWCCTEGWKRRRGSVCIGLGSVYIFCYRSVAIIFLFFFW
jgi:hypothetical protein